MTPSRISKIWNGKKIKFEYVVNNEKLSNEQKLRTHNIMTVLIKVVEHTMRFFLLLEPLLAISATKSACIKNDICQHDLLHS